MDLLRPRKTHEIRALGREADRWLQDDTLNIALAKLREENYNAWRAAANPESQHRGWLMALVIDQFAGHLASMVEDSRVVEKLEEQERKREARKRPPYEAL
jgi:hypothetical protein